MSIFITILLGLLAFLLLAAIIYVGIICVMSWKVYREVKKIMDEDSDDDLFDRLKGNKS